MLHVYGLARDIVAGVLFVGAWAGVGLGCVDTSKIPFPPAYEAKVCGSDVDCHDGEQCRFPGVDTRAICMPGINSSVAPYPPAH